jgi:membrane fusion protein (multidrug efflux system)
MRSAAEAWMRKTHITRQFDLERLEPRGEFMCRLAANLPWNDQSTKMMRSSAFILLTVLSLVLCSLLGCSKQREDHRQPQKIVVTKPEAMPITVTERYVCQIHAQRHIKIRALERGYLDAISIKEGQAVKKDDPLFQLMPVVYKSKLDVELAELDVAQMQYDYSKKLSDEKVVSKNEVSLVEAKLARAKAQAQLAKAEFNFTTFRAPFDGIIDRFNLQQGGLVEEGDTLTSLSDNSVMWVYFNVPEANYLDYMEERSEREKNQKVELLLANRKKFSQVGKISAIEADFNNQTGNISFRADFPNPDRLLRHGQTGTILISRVKKDAIVIPQRATFQILDKRYVYVVDNESVAHQRGIKVQNELEDVFVIDEGVEVGDKIVLEGTRQIHDGDKIEFEEQSPQQILANLKFHAE